MAPPRASLSILGAGLTQQSKRRNPPALEIPDDEFPEPSSPSAQTGGSSSSNVRRMPGPGSPAARAVCDRTPSSPDARLAAKLGASLGMPSPKSDLSATWAHPRRSSSGSRDGSMGDLWLGGSLNSSAMSHALGVTLGRRSKVENSPQLCVGDAPLKPKSCLKTPPVGKRSKMYATSSAVNLGRGVSPSSTIGRQVSGATQLASSTGSRMQHSDRDRAQQAATQAMRRRVHFCPTPKNTAVAITPYSRVYGKHPAFFDFDRAGRMQLSDAGIMDELMQEEEADARRRRFLEAPMLSPE